MNVLAFSVDNQRYAVDLNCVNKVFPAVAISPLPDSPAFVAGLVNVHGTLIPVANLRLKFNLPVTELALQHRFLWVTTPDREWLLWVDSVEGVQWCPPEQQEQASTLPQPSSQLSAMVALTDGVMLIQDVSALLTADEQEVLEHAVYNSTLSTLSTLSYGVS
ncbi:chemotaxis protein CheW [Alkalimonas amylolytica]|uniref:Purine-binding chemotaxis protein CheW n=1 Tax=Alkalimonas amylolytica TaxID=152573 RepID=A0A1H3ZI62_ALKAM|nr:chemotaxis protein CheW [Alkalimonas amylolytica]SEA23446.1 purine-binding chemotaxis protein CheW [Alkalimonas amylolytica]